MKNILFLLVISSTCAFAQSKNSFANDFLVFNKLKPTNRLNAYLDYDFSNILLYTDNQSVYGIIGKEHQRIRVKILYVKKSEQNGVYNVKGKSKVKKVICSFSGTIKISQVKEVKNLHYGIDSIFADQGIKQQGVVIASYHFIENEDQEHSGVFKGKLYSKWYLNSKNEIVYDDIQFQSDGYVNNGFVGIWSNHKNLKEKTCSWADYRVPNSNKDFDIGAAEFTVSKKYWSYGWLDIALKNQIPNAAIVKDKTVSEAKEWWEN